MIILSSISYILLGRVASVVLIQIPKYFCFHHVIRLDLFFILFPSLSQEQFSSSPCTTHVFLEFFKGLFHFITLFASILLKRFIYFLLKGLVRFTQAILGRFHGFSYVGLLSACCGKVAGLQGRLCPGHC